MMFKPAADAAIAKKLGDISTRDGKVEFIYAVGFFNALNLRLQCCQLPLPSARSADRTARRRFDLNPSWEATSWLSDMAARIALANIKVMLPYHQACGLTEALPLSQRSALNKSGPSLQSSS
nr:hypothetical protein [Rhizobium gei]